MRHAGKMLAKCWQNAGKMLAKCWQNAGKMHWLGPAFLVAKAFINVTRVKANVCERVIVVASCLLKLLCKAEIVSRGGSRWQNEITPLRTIMTKKSRQLHAPKSAPSMNGAQGGFSQSVFQSAEQELPAFFGHPSSPYSPNPSPAPPSPSAQQGV
jgi:hypothetical protein